MKPHTLWSEVLEVTQDALEKDADLLITLGAGSLTDAAKIVVLVSRATKAFSQIRILITQGNGQ